MLDVRAGELAEFSVLCEPDDSGGLPRVWRRALRLLARGATASCDGLGRTSAASSITRRTDTRQGLQHQTWGRLTAFEQSRSMVRRIPL